MSAPSSPYRATATPCPTCSGSGSVHGRGCPKCGGAAVAAMHGGLFLFWGRPLDGVSIAVSRIKRLTDIAIDAAAFLAWLGGLGLLIARIVRSEPSDLATIRYWTTPHSSLLMFYVGAAALCFFVYRRSVAASRREAVRFRAYGEQANAASGDPWSGRVRRKQRIDIVRAFAPEAQRAVEEAWLLARKLRHDAAEPIHLFGALLSTKKISLVFARLGIRFEQFKDKYLRLLSGSATNDAATGVAPAFRETLLSAYVDAYETKQPLVDVTDIFLALVRSDERIGELLLDLAVDADKAENVVEWIRIQDRIRRRYQRFSAAARRKPKNTMNRSMTAVATPFLDRMSEDLTKSAALGYVAPVVGRRAETESLFRAIEGGRKSVVLVGEPGTGKDAIIEGVAQRMVEEDVPTILQDKRLVRLSVSQIVAGATASEAQERLLGALYEVARAGNIVLIVPDIAGMVGLTAGSGESIDLSQVFATELSRGYFFAVATATPREYASALEGSALGSALVKVDVPEMETNEAIRVLEAKSGGIEFQNNVFFSYDAIDAAVALSGRHMHEQFLPEKAIEIAKEAASAVRNRKGLHAIVTREDVAAIIAEKTKIPLKQLTEEETKKLLTLEDRMHGRVIGQERAVTSVAAAMRRARADLREGTRPIANFLFLGPTGVGKTELAKTLAETYFGDENAMIRLDMSEYQDKASLYKLIGEPAGEKAGGVLSEAVRKKPFSLVLLDELEKANPDILTVFLQVMDDGRLTDNTGRTVDFTNVILIATSNAGAPFIQDAIRQGMAHEAMKDRLMTQELKAHFRPEFINRFDDVVVFSPLTEAQTVEIARLMLKKVAKKLETKGIGFEMEEDAVKELAAAGFDPQFGARPLRRVIQDRVDNAIADVLLRGEVGRRDMIVLVKGGGIRVDKARKL